MPARSRFINNVSATVAAVVLSLLPAGCSKAKTEAATAEQIPAESAPAAPSTEAAPTPPATGGAPDNAKPDEKKALATPAAHLASRFLTRAPVSHSAATVQVFGSKSNAANPNNTDHHLLVLGRKHTTLNGKVVAQTRCQHKGRSCSAALLAGTTAGAEFDVQPADLVALHGEVMIDGLKTAAAAYKDMPVAVVADRQVRHSAMMMAIATLKYVGALPIVAAVDESGDLVLVARQNDAANRAPVQRAADAKGLPERVNRIELHVTASAPKNGSAYEGVLIPSAAGATEVRNALHGTSRSVVSQWADIMAASYPELQQMVLSLDEDASFGDTVKLLDRLRDKCGNGSTTSNCAARTLRFSVVSLALRQPPPPVANAVDAPPAAPPGALPANVLLGIDTNRALLAPRVPIPHELLRTNAMPLHILQNPPGRAPHARPNLGGPPNGP